MDEEVDNLYETVGELEGEIVRLRALVERAVRRYLHQDERHNKVGGWPRGELAWAMFNDLSRAFTPVELASLQE